MEFDKRFTLDNLAKMSEREVLDTLYNSLVFMKTVEFIVNPEHEAGANIIEPSFDKIRKKIDYKANDLVYVMNVPAIDETKRERYRRTIFLSTKNDIIPEKGFFVKVYPSLKVKPLGLIEVTYWGGKLKRMDKDFKNLPPIKVFEQTEYFLYDYDSNTFKRVNTVAFNRVKVGLSKGKKLEELLEEVDDKTKTYILEYLKREKLLEASQEKINPFAEQLQEMYLDLFKDDGYEKRLVSGTLKINSKVTTWDVQEYLSRYKEKVSNEIFTWLRMKLIFSTITVTEYEKITEKLRENVRFITLKLEYYMIELTKLKDPEKIDWKIARTVDEWDKEGTLITKIIAGIARIQKVNIPRPFLFNKQMPMAGFISYDLEKNELYPNLAELENRRYLKKEFSSIFEDEKYKDLVLDSLREK